MPFVSYAQNAEDVVLRRAFGDRSEGFYIDVGAADPNFHSVTRTFYERGWTGVNVEPHPAFYAELVAARPRDTNLNVCLADRDGTVTLFADTELPGNSTLVPELAARYRDEGRPLVEHKVPVTTLAKVCAEHAGGEIDFLKVDVEGAEAQVLAGADFTRFRPRVLVVEANNPDEWEAMLTSQAYIRTLFDGINLFFVREEDEELVERLRAPASVLDDFVPAPLQERLDQLEEALNRAGLGDNPLDGRAFSAQPPYWEPLPLRPMRSLVVLSSTSQLYSGIGRHLFDFASRMRGRIQFEFAVDDGLQPTVEQLRRAAEVIEATVHVGRARRARSAIDFGNDDLAELVANGDWDAVECVSWANALTNESVLEALPGDRLLTYTPHYQPTESVPMSRAQSGRIEKAHRRMIQRADVIFADSPHERDLITRMSGRVGAAVYIPIGCDFASFERGTLRREQQLLFVGDHREPRKRFDRTLAVFRGVAGQHPDLKLVVIGNASNEATIPDDLVSKVEVRGYVNEAALRDLYQRSIGLVLLSDFEAFGLPVLESLASGTPVYLAENPVLRSIFGDLAGVHFCPADDDEAAAAIAHGVARGISGVVEALNGRELLRERFDAERTSLLRWNALAATWAFRRQWLIGAAP